MGEIDWRTYDRSLVAGGDINFWFDKEILKHETWYADPLGAMGKRGAPFTYSHEAIEALNVVRFRFGLTLRSTVGFARSMAKLFGSEVTVPSHTTISRRLSTLEIKIGARSYDEPIHVVVDGTGLKVYGEGEWKVRQHGVGKRRTWRKLQLAVNEANDDVLFAVFTDVSCADGDALGELLDGVDAEIRQLTGDGAFDRADCYRHGERAGAREIAFPPRRGAKISRHGNRKSPRLKRDEAIRGVRRHGRNGWKKRVGYHRRSIAETAMFRFKTLLGGELRFRDFERQAVEAFVKCKILNRMKTPRGLNYDCLMN